MKGGKRPGAGRPRGARDKYTTTLEALAAVNGELPMALWARVLSDKEAPLELRLAVARDMAPYVHARLSSTEAKVSVSTHDEFWSTVREHTALSNGHANGHAKGSAKE